MTKLLLLPLLLAVTVLPVTTSPPAYAKGATGVVVTGPGITERSLDYTRRKNDVDVGSLAEVSGIYLIYGGAIAADNPRLTEAELGPRYVLTWYQSSTVLAVSHVYPFAANGALAHIPHEQGGWVRGGPALARAMVELGAVPLQDDAAVAVSTGSTGVGSAAATQVDALETSAVGADERAWWVGLPLLAVLVAGGWLVRHRAGPPRLSRHEIGFSRQELP